MAASDTVGPCAVSRFLPRLKNATSPSNPSAGSPAPRSGCGTAHTAPGPRGGRPKRSLQSADTGRAGRRGTRSSRDLLLSPAGPAPCRAPCGPTGGSPQTRAPGKPAHSRRTSDPEPPKPTPAARDRSRRCRAPMNTTSKTSRMCCPYSGLAAADRPAPRACPWTPRHERVHFRRCRNTARQIEVDPPRKGRVVTLLRGRDVRFPPLPRDKLIDGLLSAVCLERAAAGEPWARRQPA